MARGPFHSGRGARRAGVSNNDAQWGTCQAEVERWRGHGRYSPSRRLFKHKHSLFLPYLSCPGAVIVKGTLLRGCRAALVFQPNRRKRDREGEIEGRRRRTERERCINEHVVCIFMINTQ